MRLFEEARGGLTLPIRRIANHEDQMAAFAALGEVEQACSSGIAALGLAKAYRVVLRPKVIAARRASRAARRRCRWCAS